jgi:hypothetical protein
MDYLPLKVVKHGLSSLECCQIGIIFPWMLSNMDYLPLNVVKINIGSVTYICKIPLKNWIISNPFSGWQIKKKMSSILGWCTKSNYIHEAFLKHFNNWIFLHKIAQNIILHICKKKDCTKYTTIILKMTKMNLKYNMFINIEYVMLKLRLIYLTYLQKTGKI